MKEYLKPIEDFLEQKDGYSDEPEFILLQYDVVDKMEADEIGFVAVQHILTVMEKNPLVEFGTPGPLTHFIEKFYKEKQEEYENVLKKSVEDNPTIHTVWLWNRLINGAEDNKYELLEAIRDNLALHQEIRVVAAGFVEYQKARNGVS